MTQVTGEIRINTPKEKVWQILADFGSVSVFSPTVPNSYSTSEANGGVGATRHCDLAPFGGIEERILTWNEGEGYTLEIYESQKTPPFKKAVASLAVKADGNNSIVTGVLEYELKGGVAGAIMDATVAKRQFSKSFSKLFAGLKHYAETGEAVNGQTPLNLTAAVAVA